MFSLPVGSAVVHPRSLLLLPVAAIEVVLLLGLTVGHILHGLACRAEELCDGRLLGVLLDVLSHALVHIAAVPEAQRSSQTRL